MANRDLDLTAQILELDVSALPDDVSSVAPDSTINNPYRSTVLPPPSTQSRMSRASFMGFGQSGKKSPIGRAHINRMTQNLAANQKNYLNRKSTFIEPAKMPVPHRDMWKPQEDEEEEVKKPEKQWFKTTVKMEKDMEVFETEELDSDEQEEQEGSDIEEADQEKKAKKQQAAADLEASKGDEQPDYGHLVRGVDIIDEEISTEKAYTMFRELESNEAQRSYKPSQLLQTGGSAASATEPSRFEHEIPSVRIERMQLELEQLEKELQQLEKDEIPTRMTSQTQSAKQSLQSIDELRTFMHKVVGSSQFQDLETRSNLDMSLVLQKAYSKQVDGKDGESMNPQDLKKAIQTFLAQNVAKMDSSEIVKGSQLSNEIELFIKVDQTPDEVQNFKGDLLQEQYKRFQGLQNDLDECERVVGQWNPANKFNNIFEKMADVHDEIEEFNENEESKAAPTPTASQMVPATPGGSRQSKISTKAKQFNQDLNQLQQRFQAMEDVAYDQQKVALVFDMTERALEQKDHLEILLERLTVLETINKESPNLEAKMKAIVEKVAKEIPSALLQEIELSEAVRKQIIEAAHELDSLV